MNGATMNGHDSKANGSCVDIYENYSDKHGLMQQIEVNHSQKIIYKVVLTGGPCGGKTTAQSHLCTFFENLGWKVFRVPEAASILMGGGVRFHDLSRKQRLCFQESLLKTMIEMEAAYFKLAELCDKNCLIVCDRGAMDPSAFIEPEEWERIMKSCQLNSIDLRDARYNQVIHMISAATGAEAFYTTDHHTCRSESIELARHYDKKCAQSWVGHPYFDVIDNSTDFDTKIRRMISAVCQKIGIDTGDTLKTNAKKRKFLVETPLPDDSIFPPFEDLSVEHVYLKTNPKKMQIRLRKRGNGSNFRYTHTIRKPEQLGQVVEVKTPIGQREWNNMRVQANENHFPIYKKRRCFIHNNQYFQLDIYKEPCHPRCRDLILLETYSTLDSEELKKRLPTFLNVVRDVTGQPNYSMYNLSLKEEWKNLKEFCHLIENEREPENEAEK